MKFALRLDLAAILAVAGLLASPQSTSLVAQAAPATCAKVWLGHEEEIEQALKGNEIARFEDVPVGVTKPQRAILDLPSPVAGFTWKPLTPRYRNGYFESYKSEIAAYRLDRMLDLHMVPPIVERQIDGTRGAAVYWLDNTKMWDKDHPPQGPEPQWSYQIARMKMLDLLIANIDRNQGNLLYDGDWHLFLIDHSRAFIGKKDLKKLAPPAHIDRVLWSKMEALTFESLDAALGDLVGKGELKALIIRRDLMAVEIRKMVAQRGESSVFFTE